VVVSRVCTWIILPVSLHRCESVTSNTHSPPPPPPPHSRDTPFPRCLVDKTSFEVSSWPDKTPMTSYLLKKWFKICIGVPTWPTLSSWFKGTHTLSRAKQQYDGTGQNKLTCINSHLLNGFEPKCTEICARGQSFTQVIPPRAFVGSFSIILPECLFPGTVNSFPFNLVTPSNLMLFWSGVPLRNNRSKLWSAHNPSDIALTIAFWGVRNRSYWSSLVSSPSYNQSKILLPVYRHNSI